MTPRQTPDAVREAYRQGQIDMRERAAQVCDRRGAEEQEAFGLVRGTQNYFRARNAVRELDVAALDSRAGDAGEGCEDGRTADNAVDFVFNRLAKKLGLAEWQVVEGSEEWEGDVSATLHRLLIDAGIIDDETGAVATLATPAPAPNSAGDAGEGKATEGIKSQWDAIRPLLAGLISDVECAIHFNEGVDALSGEGPEEARNGIERMDALVAALATPAPAVDDVDIDSPAARLDMVRVALTGIIDNPASAVPLARAGLDFCDLTEAQRKEMRGDA